MATWQDRTEADITAWWSPEDGKPIIGELLGLRAITDRDGRKRAVWVIQTSQSTMARLKGEGTGKEFPAGTVIGVGHRAKLAGLIELYSTIEGFDVAINPGEKIRIGNGRTMWKLQVKTRGGTPRQTALLASSLIPKQLGTGSGAGVSGGVSAPTADEGHGEEAGDDDIPF